MENQTPFYVIELLEELETFIKILDKQTPELKLNLTDISENQTIYNINLNEIDEERRIKSNKKGGEFKNFKNIENKIIFFKEKNKLINDQEFNLYLDELSLLIKEKEISRKISKLNTLIEKIKKKYCNYDIILIKKSCLFKSPSKSHIKLEDKEFYTLKKIEAQEVKNEYEEDQEEDEYGMVKKMLIKPIPIKSKFSSNSKTSKASIKSKKKKIYVSATEPNISNTNINNNLGSNINRINSLNNSLNNKFVHYNLNHSINQSLLHSFPNEKSRRNSKGLSNFDFKEKRSSSFDRVKRENSQCSKSDFSLKNKESPISNNNINIDNSRNIRLNSINSKKSNFNENSNLTNVSINPYSNTSYNFIDFKNVNNLNLFKHRKSTINSGNSNINSNHYIPNLNVLNKEEIINNEKTYSSFLSFNKNNVNNPACT